MSDDARGFDAPVQQSRRDPAVVASALHDWLAPRLPGDDLAIAGVSTPQGTGVANETLMIDASWRRDSGETDGNGFVVRVAVDDPLYLDADVAIAYEMYRTLAEEPGIPVPQVFGYEPDPAVLGAPFFVMQRIPGEVPADQPYYTEAGFVVEATPEQRRRMWEDAVDVMCRFHQVDPKKFPFLARPKDGATGLEQDLAYWRRYYRSVMRGRTHPTLDVADRWLIDNLPDDRPTAPAWGDARVCNMIFRDFRCVAVLDWDGISLAGGESDLAWWCVMEHTGGKRTSLPGLGSFDELVQIWEERTGLQARNLRWHVAYALYKLGAIVLRLNEQMLANGALPAGTDISTNSQVVQQLVVLLDAPAAGPVDVTLPPLRALGTSPQPAATGDAARSK